MKKLNPIPPQAEVQAAQAEEGMPPQAAVEAVQAAVLQAQIMPAKTIR